MRRAFLLIAILSLALTLLVQPALAQVSAEPAGFKNVTLWVYPEYDDPRLLIMLEGKVTGASLPAPVRFLVPAGAEMYSAGSKDAQGTYTGGPPNRKSSDLPGWDEISYDLKNETFRVEYYSDEIKGLPEKIISYDFRYLYPISDLRVVVQQPLQSGNFTVTPAGTASKEGQFNVQTYNYQNLTPNAASPLHFDVSYVKSNLDSSIQSETNPLGALKGPGSAGGSGGGTSPSAGLMTLVITGIVVVGLALFFVLPRLSKNSRRAVYVPQKVRAKSAKQGGNIYRTHPPAMQPASKKVNVAPERKSHARDFCTQCGNPVERAHTFCASCGSKLG